MEHKFGRLPRSRFFPNADVRPGEVLNPHWLEGPVAARVGTPPLCPVEWEYRRFGVPLRAGLNCL